MSAPWSRRDVLKSLGLAAGVSLIPGPSQAEVKQLGAAARAFPSNYKTPARHIKLTKPVTAIVCGAGRRGRAYGEFASQYPGQLDIVGLAEPIEIRNERYSRTHAIPAANRFDTWERIFERPKFADAIIITTPDQLHYGPCMAALAAGYDVLLEKPISPSEAECREILAKTLETGRIVAVCHVLRYAPYFVKLREIMHSGVLGKVASLQHLEPIGFEHMTDSYVRGLWHNSKQSNPILLAKSCHDLDILRWLVEQPCQEIQAFGELTWFKKENAPAGSTDRCTGGCAVEAQCPYSALRIYHRNRRYLSHFDLPEEKEKQGDGILEYLRNTDYGRCVYRMDNDQPDHYVANIKFEGGVTAAFSMEGLTSYQGRRTRVMGSLGDVVGDMNQLVVTDFLTGHQTTWNQETDGHGGGDFPLVADWVQAITQKDPTLLSSPIAQSIESHIMGFMAERSRKEKRVMDVRL
jgi:Oxidoreductase family, NAD-binding Rossmann fold/Oxidoreductase family, C-terminal alpha/beta domain